jgi:hypothetical protein
MRYAAVTVILFAARVNCAPVPDTNDICPSGVIWSGTVAQGLTKTGCTLPSNRDLLEGLSNMRVHMAGDSTLRMPVQYFQAATIGCPDNIKALEVFLRANPKLLGADAEFCKMLVGGPKLVKTLTRPLGSLGLTFEPWQHVEGSVELPGVVNVCVRVRVPAQSFAS